VFVKALLECLGSRLTSVIVHGSATFDDLAPGYGDIDFVVVCAGELSETDAQALMRARAPFRSGKEGALAEMLEGAFLPARLLDPREEGLAVWWGTSGERLWDRNKLGWFCHQVVRDRGIVIHGDDVREQFEAPSPEELTQEIRKNCRAMREHGRGGSLHSIDWLLTAARLLLWLEEGRLSSKTEAAEWGAENAKGAWRALLPQAKAARLRPGLAEGAEMQSWLNGLDPAIAEAAKELEDRLMAVGFRPA
jgi:hypothetical protein